MSSVLAVSGGRLREPSGDMPRSSCKRTCAARIYQEIELALSSCAICALTWGWGYVRDWPRTVELPISGRIYTLGG